MAGRRAYRFFCLGAASILIASLSHAQPASDAAPAASSAISTQPPALDLVVIDRSGAVVPPGLETRIASWFDESRLVVHSQRQDTLDPAAVLQPVGPVGVRVWVVSRSPNRLRLYFTVTQGPDSAPRYLVTDVDLPRGLDEVGMERVAQVAYLSSTALWAGRLQSTRTEVERGLRDDGALDDSLSPPSPTAASPAVAPPAQLPPPWTPPPPTPPTPGADEEPTWRVLTGVQYALRSRGDEGLAHGLGALLRLTQGEEDWEVGGQLRALLLFPDTVDRQQLELDVRGYSLEVGPTLSRRLVPGTWGDSALLVGADLVRFAATSREPNQIRTHTPSTELRPTLAAHLGVSVETGRLRLSIAGQLTIQLTRPRYEMEASTGTVTLLEPWVIQPGMMLGVQW